MITETMVSSARAYLTACQINGEATPLFDLLKTRPSCSVVLRKNGELLAVSGAIQENEQVATAFILLSKQQKLSFADGCTLIRLHRRYVEDVFKELPVNRLQAVAPAWDSRSIRWMAALGFLPEAILKQYLPGGQDAMVLYVLRSEIENGHRNSYRSRRTRAGFPSVSGGKESDSQTASVPGGASQGGG